MLFYFFFFSSRRRHTRLVSDWSSDVCSSDLVTVVQASGAVGGSESLTRPGSPGRPAQRPRRRARGHRRSEERRVGKECRTRGLTSELKEKESTKALTESNES